MEEIVFEPFPKIPRFSAGCVITEKIDGTNACIVITDDGRVAAQSRKRIITPDDDNFGFARWVDSVKEELVTTLGPGRHFGEWWGSGIQRGYGLTEKRFSLFNTKRWREASLYSTTWPEWLHVVPLIHEGAFATDTVEEALQVLANLGSLAVAGYMNPEGIVVMHLPTRALYKKFLDPVQEANHKSALVDA